MPDLDIPGVRAASGLLSAVVSAAPAAAASSVEVLRWQSLGQNLVVGLHGYTEVSQGWTSVDGQSQEWIVTLDPNATGPVDFTDPQLIYQQQREVQVATAVGIENTNRSSQFYHDLPIFTVRNANLIVTNFITQKRVTLAVFYRIYEASDSAFLRIASVTLARGV